MKRINVRVIALVFLALVFVSPAGDAAAQGQGFYLGVFGGYVKPDDMNFTTTWGGTTASADVSTDDTGILGVKFGWIPPQAKFLALEMEFGHIFEHSYSYTGAGGSESGDVYLSNVMFNLLFRYPTGKIHPYLGAGIGWSYFNVEATGYSVRYGPYYAAEDDYPFAWQFLAGVDFEIANNMSIDLGYRYFGTDPSLIATDIEYRANIFTVGLNFRF